MQAKRVLARFLIFGMMGLLLEVFQGAVGDLLHMDWDMRGHTSPWMILDYGLLGVVLMPIARPLIGKGIPLPLRAIVYMLGIFLVEYVSGIIFHKVFSLHVWNYDGMAYNLHGQIALQFVVPWYLIGLCAEYLHKKVDACAVVLARSLSTEQVLAYEPSAEGAPRED